MKLRKSSQNEKLAVGFPTAFFFLKKFFHKLFYIFHKSIEYKMGVQMNLDTKSYKNETNELSRKTESYQ